MEKSVKLIMTDREILLKKLSTMQFATLELQLYLDTHSQDKSAFDKMTEYRNSAKILKNEYENKYGPLTKSSKKALTWSWVKGPWPWESEDDY